MAIDRRTLEGTILTFGQKAAYGFVPNGTWNYDPQSWEWKSLPDSARIEESRSLYKAAGYSVSNPLHLKLLFNSNPAIKRMMIAIASMWRETLGIETESNRRRISSFSGLAKRHGPMGIARLGWTADYNDAGNFLDIFRSGSPNNDATYVNSQFDSLLDRAAATPSSSVRRGVLEQAEKLMLSEYPVIPIYFYSSKRLIKPYIKGAKTNPLNRLYSKHLFFAVN